MIKMIREGDEHLNNKSFNVSEVCTASIIKAMNDALYGGCKDL
jgi:hypothetical protein